MSTSRNLVALCAVAAALLLAGPLRAAGPDLGQPATPQDIAEFDLGVLPNGDGLPPGSGDAKQGQVVYETHCVACHAAGGVGKPADALVGGKGSLVTAKPMKTVGSYWPYATILFDFVRRAMPYSAPRSLSNEQVYAVTAYVLFLNGIVPQDLVLNKQTLPNVAMPNRDGFINAWPGTQR